MRRKRGEKRKGEWGRTVSRTFARVQTLSRRAWLTAARCAVRRVIRPKRLVGRSEVDSLVSRTFARAQTPSRRAWLTAARRAVPGDRPTPSPRPVLTATPDFVSRHRSARRGRAPLRALFCPVRGLPPPVAVSSTARHALPDPSYHPVRAADSQHTLDCKTLVAEQRRRTARVCRAARPLRAVTRRDVLTTITQITYYSAEA